MLLRYDGRSRQPIQTWLSVRGIGVLPALRCSVSFDQYSCNLPAL